MATQDIFQKCIPAYRTNVAQCGLLTVCDAAVPNPSELDSIFQDGDGKYRIMEAAFMHDLELNACQAEQSNLWKFIKANKVDLSKKMTTSKINSGLYHISPWIQAKRINPINNNWWAVSGGLKCLIDGTPDGAGTYWRYDAVSNTGIPANAGWFNAVERVFVDGLTGGGSSSKTAWKVISSSVVGSAVRIVLQGQNANSSLPAARLTPTVTGVMERGTANVDDFESFCKRPPGLLTQTYDVFWMETTRDSTCLDEPYEQWRALVFANNPEYAELSDLPTIEFNKQTGEDFQRRWCNTFFSNKALQYQYRGGEQLLDEIVSVGPGGSRCVGRRANAIGIMEQMAECNRLVDCQGAILNLPALFLELYRMNRIRKDSGSKAVNIIEVAMPQQFMPLFNLAMLNYYKTQSGGNVTTGVGGVQFWQDVSKSQKTAPLGFVYQDYPLVYPMGVTLRVFTDTYFDDYLATQEQAGQGNLGRRLWIIDWSRVYMGLFKSERVVAKTGDLKTLQAVDPTYACVMKIYTTTTTLTSWTWTAVHECPAGDLIIENFANEIPEHQDLGTVTYPATTTTTTTTTTTAP